MKKTAWIGCACLLALASCGGESGDDSRGTGSVKTNPMKDAGDDRGNNTADDDAEEDAGGRPSQQEDDDVVATPVEDDDLVTIEDDDLFVPVEDDDFAPAEPEPENVVNDDDIVVQPPDDDRPVMTDDDVPVADDDIAADDDLVVTPDDDVVADDDITPADDDVIVTPEPDVDPGECQLVGQSLGPSYCQLNEQCGNQYRYSYCNDLGTGSWSCQCSKNYVYSYFELSGVDQNTACPAVRDLCNDDVVPQFTGEPVCEPSYQSLGTNYCQTSTTCRREADLGNGVLAVESQTSSNYCSEYNAGELSCSCSSNNRGLSYTLTGVPVADSCDLGMGLCTGEETPFTGEPMCTVSYQNANATYCNLQRACGQTADLGDGVMASLNVYDNSSCQFSTDAPASCSCSNSNANLRFQMDVEAGPEACETASSICDTTEEIVPEGPLECTRASQSSGSTYCSASIQCAQDAVVGGTTIGVYGNISVSCQPNGDEWSCSCSSNIDSASLSVTAADGWDACTAASDQCPDLVEVDVTTSGGYYYY